MLILTKSEVKEKWGAFALLTLVWTEGEAFLRRITPEPDFRRGSSNGLGNDYGTASARIASFTRNYWDRAQHLSPGSG